MDETRTYAVTYIRRNAPEKKYLATVDFRGATRMAYGTSEEDASKNLTPLIEQMQEKP